MGKLIQTLACTVIGAISIANAVDSKRQDASLGQAWKMIEGDWIRKDFVQDVQKQRSIFAVIKTNGIGFYPAYRKTLTYQFFDEWGQHNVLRRAKATEVHDILLKGDQVELRLDDGDFPRSIRLLGKGSKPKEIEIEGIVYMRETKDWVARAILAGKYQDERGRHFEFDAKGHFHWPDRKGQYSLASKDFEGLESDYFLVSKRTAAPEPFCFHRNGEDLFIYTAEMKKINEDVHEAVRCSKTILYRLTRTTQQ